jgi:hypothetical protein
MSSSRKADREALRARKKQRQRTTRVASSSSSPSASGSSSASSSSDTPAAAAAATAQRSRKTFQSSSSYKYAKHRAGADAAAVFQIDDAKSSSAAKGALVDEEAELKRLSVADIYVRRDAGADQLCHSVQKGEKTFFFFFFDLFSLLSSLVGF